MAPRLDFRCTEDFDAMPCTARGRHCAQCDTEVVDLDRMGWLARQRFLATPEDKCVRFTRRPSRWRAKAVAVAGLLLSTAVPAAAQVVPPTHVCSPGPAGLQDVWVGGVGGRGPLAVVLRPLQTLTLQVRRFVRERTRSPHGNGFAHVATDDGWRRVTVACDSGRLPRRIQLEDGEAIVGDLPDHEACRIRFVGQGERRTTTVEFWVSDTASEALEHGEREHGTDGGAAEARSSPLADGDPRARGSEATARGTRAVPK